MTTAANCAQNRAGFLETIVYYFFNTIFYASDERKYILYRSKSRAI